MRFCTYLCALLGLAVLAGALAAAQKPREIEIPCHVVNVVDGDTLDVSVAVKCRVKLVGGGWLDVNKIIVRIRLLDVWAPELRGGTVESKRRGIAAAKYLAGLADGRDGFLRIPIEGNEMLDYLTLDRLLAELFVDGRSVGAALIQAGHASSTKAENRE